MASRIRELFSSDKEDPVYRANYAQRQGVNSRSNYAYKQHHHGPLPVIELRVPMCCEKCKEKVQEELEEMEGVKDVLCDQYNQRVTVTGYADPLRVLKRVKKVKKKSEFFSQGSYIDRSTHVSSTRHTPSIHPTGPSINREVRYSGQPLVHTNGHPGLTRTNSFGRSLARQPSYGRVAHYDGVRHHDFETRDLQRDYYGVRRMPSFKKHRYHDAEYVSMGDQVAIPYGETHYVRHHHQRPVLQSQVSFSKLPVRNPHYVKPMYHEY